jgi:hypothetical protein
MRVWNTNKVWLLIGLTYIGFYLFIGFKAVAHMVAIFQIKFFPHNRSQQNKVKKIFQQ